MISSSVQNLKPSKNRWLRRVFQLYSSMRRSTSSSRTLTVCWATACLRASSPDRTAAADSTKLLGHRSSGLSMRAQPEQLCVCHHIGSNIKDMAAAAAVTWRTGVSSTHCWHLGVLLRPGCALEGVIRASGCPCFDRRGRSDPDPACEMAGAVLASAKDVCGSDHEHGRTGGYICASGEFRAIATAYHDKAWLRTGDGRNRRIHASLPRNIVSLRSGFARGRGCCKQW